MKDIRREIERRTTGAGGREPRVGSTVPTEPRRSGSDGCTAPRRRGTGHEAPRPSPRRLAPRTRQLLSDYLELTKPKVQSLLLLTTIATMYVAGDPSPGWSRSRVLAATSRPAAPGRQPLVRPRHRRAHGAHRRRARSPPGASPRAPRSSFGFALAPLSLLELSLTVNPLAAGLSFAGFLGYVLVYTIWLKRRTPQNIVIGGAAGAVPPLVGWAAVTGLGRAAPR